jgi:hypothetical protein
MSCQSPRSRQHFEGEVLSDCVREWAGADVGYILYYGKVRVFAFPLDKSLTVITMQVGIAILVIAPS